MSPTPDPSPQIVRDGTGYTLRVDGTEQSYVDLDDPHHLRFDYIQRMASVIDLLGEPGQRLRFVHIGGAAMTVPRYVVATRPTSPQVVLEPDAALTEMVRDQLPLPRRSGIKVRPVDGRTGIAAMPDDYAEVLVLDAFAGSQVPGELVTREAFADMARVLDDHGTMILNLGDRAPFAWTRRVLAGLREVLPELMVSGESATLKGRRHGNLLVTAARTSVPTLGLKRSVAGSPFPYSVLSPADVASRFAGGDPFTDADTEPSPGKPTLGAYFG